MLQPVGGDLAADDLEAAYAYPLERTWLRLNFVATLDGAVVDAHGHPEGLSSASDQEVFALLRGLCDVVLVGAGTARAEQYAPVRPSEVDQDMRARLGLAPLPPIAVVSTSLDVPESLLDAGDDRARTLVFTADSAPAGRRADIADRAEVLVCGDRSVDLVAVRETLGARGLRRIVAEGGPHLTHALFSAGVLDEFCLTMSPLVIGGGGPRLVAGAALDWPVRMRLGHVLVAGDELLMRYVREGA
jgi:riboflavin biosynthesis pyrimidine reductase